MDFVAEDNICGQTLLRLVSRINCSIANILRLKHEMPRVYNTPLKHEQVKYGELINLDLNYFKLTDFDTRLANNEDLKRADQELKSNHGDFLAQFYNVAENIVRFVQELNTFIQDVEEGIFLQCSLEAIFQDNEGKQLMCEALHLLGVSLLLLDRCFEGPIRERLLVAHYRYTGTTKRGTSINFDEVCQVMRSTGYTKGGKRPATYPEGFFSRVALPEKIVKMVIGRLRTDDIYNLSKTYPDVRHRSTALADQASMIFVILHFAPNLLKNDFTAMKEIVDKFFLDNWVISFHSGHVVNLVSFWDPYKAAKSALANTVSANNVRSVAADHGEALKELLLETSKLDSPGVVSVDYVIDNTTNLLKLVTNCNVTLRWLTLHTSSIADAPEQQKKCKQVRDLVLQEAQCDQRKVFELLLSTAILEMKVTTALKDALRSKHKTWSDCKAQCHQNLCTIIDIMTDQDDSIKSWLQDQMKQIKSLDVDQSSSASRKAALIAEALEESMSLERVSCDARIVQFLSNVVNQLKQMIRLSSVGEDFLLVLEIVGDISYGVNVIDLAYTKIMQDSIESNPDMVEQLRCLFSKMANSMNKSVLRISQAKSSEFYPISTYYSSELINYVQRVMQVIPEAIFRQMKLIADIESDDLKQLPSKIGKEDLISYHQPDSRLQLTQLVHSIAQLACGMTRMKATLVGVLEIDAKALLREGIRNELHQQLEATFDSSLSFPSKQKVSDLMDKLDKLTMKLDGLQKSFQLVQDFIGYPSSGLQTFQDELSVLIKRAVQDEKILFDLPKKNPGIFSQTPFSIGKVDNMPRMTFLGKLLDEIVSLSSPRLVFFLKPSQSWYDQKTKVEMMSPKLFKVLFDAIRVCGMVGLDQILSLKIQDHIDDLCKEMDKNIFRVKDWIQLLENLSNSLNPVENVIAQPSKFYGNFIGSHQRLFNILFDEISVLGQLQLLRGLISWQLQIRSKMEVNLWHSAMNNLNKALLRNTEKAEGRVDIAATVAPALQRCGFTDPKSSTYTDIRVAPRMTELLFLVTASGLTRSSWSAKFGTLVTRRSQDPIDFQSFIVGACCLLNHLPDFVGRKLMLYLSQYTRSFRESQGSAKTSDPLVLAEVKSAEHVQELFSQHHSELKRLLSEQVPKTLK